MPRTPSMDPPSYRLHKPSGLAVVTISGRDHYLGPHGSPESHVKYDALIAEWLANGRRPKPQARADGDPPDTITITELLAQYLDHARVYYGTSRELVNMRLVMDALERKFGPMPAVEFKALALCELRQSMIDGTHRPGTRQQPARPLSRKVINARMNRVRRIFKWAVAQELVPPEVYQSLAAVEPLRQGRSAARETSPIKPVSEEVVYATLPFLPEPAADMVLLQLHTGMRAGELVQIRTGDIDTTGKVWVYTPASHKTAHHGHTRRILIGPRGQAVLRPHLKTDLTAYVFSPREAAEARQAERRRNRKTPMTPSQRARKRKRRPKKAPGARYQVCSYAQAIMKACEKAFPPPEPLARRPGETIKAWKARLTEAQKAELRAWRKAHHWHPHQLRHTAATKLRKEGGLELAQTALGHASADATQIYAEADFARAAELIGRVG